MGTDGRSVPPPSLKFQWKNTDSVGRCDVMLRCLWQAIYRDRELGLHSKLSGAYGLLLSDVLPGLS